MPDERPPQFEPSLLAKIHQSGKRLWRLEDYTSGAKPPRWTDPQTNGELWRLWPATGNSDVHVVYCEMKAGVQNGLHWHPGNHFGVVVKGTALIWIDGVWQEQHEGDLLHVPQWLPHAYGSAPGQDAIVVDFVNPLMTAEDITFAPKELANPVAASFEAKLEEMANRHAASGLPELR